MLIAIGMQLSLPVGLAGWFLGLGFILTGERVTPFGTAHRLELLSGEYVSQEATVPPVFLASPCERSGWSDSPVDHSLSEADLPGKAVILPGWAVIFR